jgi:hypothetical protein
MFLFETMTEKNIASTSCFYENLSLKASKQTNHIVVSQSSSFNSINSNKKGNFCIPSLYIKLFIQQFCLYELTEPLLMMAFHMEQHQLKDRHNTMD